MLEVLAAVLTARHDRLRRGRALALWPAGEAGGRRGRESAARHPEMPGDARVSSRAGGARGGQHGA
eukprot:2168964-Alexandrium_andersonii.AAC.1